MILDLFRRGTIQGQQVALGRQQHQRAIALFRQRQRKAPHMFTRLRHLFRQHQKRATLRQFGLSHSPREIFMAEQTTGKRQPSAADGGGIVIQPGTHIFA